MTSAEAFERSVAELRRFQLQRPLGMSRGAWGPSEDGSATCVRDAVGDPEGRRAPAWWPVQGSGEAQAAVREDDGPIIVPPGYRLVPEAERLATLADLRRKLADLNDRYARSPLRIETEGQRKTQDMLRAKLQETENAVKLFSRVGGVLVET